MTGQGCIAEGKVISYECTVDGGALTLWIGSALPSCPGIFFGLLHTEFTNGVNITCNNLTAISVGFSGTNYTSKLILTATAKLNKKIISCAHGDGTVIGSDAIKVGGLLVFCVLIC